MLTRVLIILFSVATMLLAVFVYFRANINPYKLNAIQTIIEKEQIQESEPERLLLELTKIKEQGLILDYLSSQYFVGIFLLIISISLYSTCLHLFLEKLFFKKFYESPSYFDGFRRGILLGIGLYLAQLMRLSNVEILTIAGVVLIIILLEIGFTAFAKKDLAKLIRKG